MPIEAADIKFFLSGGGANSDPNASLGGARSSTAIAAATLHNLFDIVSSAEAAAGMVDYRCFYVLNDHASLTLQSAVTWIQTQAANANVAVAIGLDPAGVNGTATTIANESTAPAGVAFTTPTTEGGGLSIGNVPFGQHQAIWVRRTVTAGAPADDLDSAVIRVKGDTAE